jgi:hypothetical protein
MSHSPYLEFKIAAEEWELEQIHRLNYRTFVDEIPQHPPNPAGRLVDRHHAQNTYLVCRQGGRIIGMLAVRGQRPFSLDAKLHDLDSYLPPHRSVCEVRLLAVEEERRLGQILPGLLRLVSEYCASRGHDLAVISGTVRQLRLYEHLGFVPFGPLVGTPEALYQPMYVTREAFDPGGRSARDRPPGARSPGAPPG